MKNKKNIIISFFLLTVLSCGTIQHTKYSVQPVSSEQSKIYWQDGTAYLLFRNKDFELFIASSEQSPSHFHAVVTNLSKEEKIVSEENFSLIDQHTGEKFLAYSPEKEAKDFDKIYQEEVDYKKHLETADGWQTIGNLLNTLSGDVDEKERKKRREGDLERAAAIERLETRLIEIQQQKKEFLIQSLRKNTLLPGKSTSGLIYFPHQGNTGIREVQFQVAGQTLKATFDVKKTIN